MHFLGFWILRPNPWLYCLCCTTQRVFLARTANFFLQEKLQQPLHIQEMLESLRGCSLIWDIHSVLTVVWAEMLLLFELFLHVRISAFPCTAVLTRNSSLKAMALFLGWKGTTLKAGLLQRQAPTAHLAGLQKEMGINKWMSQVKQQGPQIRSDYRTYRKSSQHNIPAVPSEHCDSAFCQH